jgi:hypothetical protein
LYYIENDDDASLLQLCKRHVMPPRNSFEHANVIALQKLFFLSSSNSSLYGRRRGASPCRALERPDRPAKEASMELKTRLNVLVTIMSFGFLAAIVFGVI